MSFRYTSPSSLRVPEKCKDCPAICVVVDGSNKRDEETEREVSAALNFDEKRHDAVQKFLVKFGRQDGVETLEEARRHAAALLDQKEDDAEADQVDIDELTAKCEGPTTLDGVTKLGRAVTATVCGSEAYGNETDRFFVGPGHGQTQHEQVHVNRIAFPGEE
jgi:hypothetical protein